MKDREVEVQTLLLRDRLLKATDGQGARESVRHEQGDHGVRGNAHHISGETAPKDTYTLFGIHLDIQDFDDIFREISIKFSGNA